MAKIISCLVFAAVFTCTCSASIRHANSNRTLFDEHMLRVNGFTCSQPQLRVVKPEELGITISSDESYYPSATVLKKCSCSGYCANRHETCSASETETVELVFKVKNLVTGNNSSDYYRRVNATHETACSCQLLENQIK